MSRDSNNSERLSEQVYQSRDIKVDLDAGFIRGVKLHGNKSANGRLYADTAMEDLSGLYEGAPIRLGHDKKEWDDTLGSVAKVTKKTSEAIYGDIRLLKKHASYGSLMEAAEEQPHLLALSHEVSPKKYDAYRSDDGTLVVKRVYKVDAIAVVTGGNGGVNANLFEEREPGMADTPKTLAELKELYPQLCESLIAEATSAQADNLKLVEAIAARDQAQAALKEAKDRITELESDKAKAARVKEVMSKAIALKAVCDEGLAEALSALDDTHVDRILSNQPKLTEEVPTKETSEEKTPEQKSGLSQEKLPFSYSKPFSRLAKYSNQSN